MSNDEQKLQALTILAEQHSVDDFKPSNATVNRGKCTLYHECSLLAELREILGMP